MNIFFSTTKKYFRLCRSRSSRGLCWKCLMFWEADNLNFHNHIRFNRKFFLLSGLAESFRCVPGRNRWQKWQTLDRSFSWTHASVRRLQSESVCFTRFHLMFFSSHHSPDPLQSTRWQIWWQICHRICHRDQNQCISSHKCSVSLSIDCLCYRQSKYIVPIEFGSLHNVYGVIWRRNHPWQICHRPWQICHSFCHVTNVSCEWIWQTEMHQYDYQ